MKNLLYLVLSACFSSIFFISCEKEKDLEVKACFRYNPTEIVAGKIQFENCSENATSFLWDFGDGSTSNEKEPQHTFKDEFPFIVTLIAINGNNRDTLIQKVFDEIMLYKPNIYIYPTLSIKLNLEITFPLGGSITESIPKYNDGWSVSVDPNGLIDNKFEYLFYESVQPDLFQYNQGWCVPKIDLKQFFEKNMNLYNFSSNEIADFNEYWIPRLTDHEYYIIYPQTNEIIDKIIKLNLSTQPDNINRLFYGIVGIDRNTEIEAPSIVSFTRNGFFIMEWGVFLK